MNKIEAVLECIRRRKARKKAGRSPAARLAERNRVKVIVEAQISVIRAGR